MSSYYEKILATGEVKCIDEEVPFEVPNGWEWCRMQDVITFVNGRAYKKEELLPQGKYKILRVGNFFTNNEWYYSDLELPEDKYCYNGDLLYAWSASFGPQIWNGDKTIFHYHIWNVKFNSRVLFREYLYYFFLFDKTQVKASTTGSTMVHVSMENMKPRLIPIPPVNEQKRIVHEIENIIPLIERYGTFQNKKEILDSNIKASLNKSILQEAIQGKLVPQITEEGTAQELLEQIKAEKQKLVKEGKLKKSALNDSVIFRGDDNKYWEKSTECMECIDDKIPFEIPSTWCWVRHNQLFEISGGSQPPKSQFVDSPKSGYIRLYQIRDYGSNPMPVYIPQEKANKITKEGDIILARYGGSLGKVFWAKDGAYNVAMAKVIPLFDSEFVNKQYLFLFYQSSIYQYLVKDHSRSAQAGFNKDDLKDLFFPLPPLEEQSRIVEKYKSVTSIMS